MEAEYIALSTSMRSLIPLKTLVGEVAKSLMEDSTFLTNTYSSVFENNNGAPHTCDCSKNDYLFF